MMADSVFAHLHLGGSYLAWLVPLLALEAMVVGRKQCFLYRLLHWRQHPSTRCDVLVSMLFIFGFAPFLSRVFSFDMVTGLQVLLDEVPKLDLASILLDSSLRWLVYLVLIDFGDYWVHRALHRVPALWRIHSFHHSATDFNILTGNRLHFAEEALVLMGRALVLAPLAISLPEFFTLLLARRVIDQLQHSELPWTYGWLGRVLFMSPLQHRLHHSTRTEDHDANYGNILVGWDRLFGTYRLLAPDRDVIEIGTGDAAFDLAVARKPFRMMVVLQFQALLDVGRAMGRALGLAR